MTIRNTKPSSNVQAMDPFANMSNEELRALVLKQTEEMAALKARGTKSISHRASAKGAYSVYGLGQWPVTLYQDQWERLLDAAPGIVDGINAAKEAGLLSPGKEESDSDSAARLARFKNRFPQEYANYVKETEKAAVARAAKGK